MRRRSWMKVGRSPSRLVERAEMVGVDAAAAHVVDDVGEDQLEKRREMMTQTRP